MNSAAPNGKMMFGILLYLAVNIVNLRKAFHAWFATPWFLSGKTR